MKSLGEQIVERLATVEGVAQIGDEIDFLAAQEALRKAPALFVIEESETAAAELRSHVLRQTRTARIAVVLVLTRATRRGDRAGEASKLRAAIREALFGFRAEGALRALFYRGFAVRQIEAGIVAFELSFDTEFRDQGDIQ